MDLLVFVIVLAVFYGVATFFDLLFKSCLHYPYDAFLHNTGLTVKFLRLNLHTTFLNRTIVKWGSSRSQRIFNQSFSAGVVITLIILPIGIIILLFNLFHETVEKTATAGGSRPGQNFAPQIEILLPGVNLPLNEFGYYISALAVCTIVHELGHALAAVSEDVPVMGFGINLLFCFPVAYTVLSTDHLNALKSFRKLRILCGGIWHNIILAVVCFLLYSTLGFVLAPFFRVNQGVVVSSVQKTSPLLGPKGIFVGDVLIEINGCKVKTMDDWYDCLLKSIRNKPAYCVSSDFIRINDESAPIVHGFDGVLQCCDPANNKLACFEYIDDISNDDPVEIPQHMCLDIRNTIEKSSGFCKTTCDDGFCIRPLINNVTTILSIIREDRNIVVYIGHPADVSQTVSVSEYVPKTNILPSKFADTLVLFLKYNIVFSFGLALMNAIPCFGLDGYHISSTIINNFLVNKLPERGKRELVVLVVTSLGTLLFVSSVLRVLWSTLLSNLY